MIDWTVAAAGLVVGLVVGLTGMGGGALMTPVLVLFFGVPPLTAVSNDLVVSALMKPVGGAVHIRRKTVSWPLVGWLCAGSVPAAFAGVAVTRALGGADTQLVVKMALGITLVLAAALIGVKQWLQSRRTAADGGEIVVRPVRTVLIGVVGGLVVGMTSVGSGSLVVVALLLVYPALAASKLVGTDLVQAVPLVAAAATGHLLFGDFHLELTLSLLAGSIPGVWAGARYSSRANGTTLRALLAVVLLASGLKMLNVPNEPLVVAIVVAAGLVAVATVRARRAAGGAPAQASPALASVD
ncbi:sulfite exporter TauE/SafE family protein [Longispora albida]|uniref:sulfite exporter TauE/SafE family protein n=1 Tax=Longispora albida TaxID=203523 RepID=UPI00036FA208|nr:sulfite exporter TauE/SafE family protein [Longispora albida]